MFSFLIYFDNCLLKSNLIITITPAATSIMCTIPEELNPQNIIPQIMSNNTAII